jgi:hypothetical protein
MGKRVSDGSRTPAAPDEVDDDASTDALIARVFEARKSGTSDGSDVDELLERAAKRNRAAIDRLAR